MKKIAFTLIFYITASAFLIASVGGSTKIERTTSGGGVFGYSDTEQKWVGDKCVIRCTGSGYTACPTRCLTQSAVYGTLIEQAEDIILTGVLSGTLYNTDINAYVTWVAVPNGQGSYDTDFLVIQN
jgi:hypothetical protein